VSTNNISYIKETHTDFSDVLTFVSANTGLTVTQGTTQIQVTSQNTLNTYTITTVENSQTNIVVVNSDTTTNSQFLVNYQESIAVPSVIEASYKPVVSTVDEKEGYLTWIKSANHKEIVNPINIVDVQINKNSLYTEVVLEVETESSENIFIKTVKTPDISEPRIISVSPAPSVYV
jgi:hypothetical protein